MTASYEVRPAQPEDVRAIAEFQTASWREAYAGLVPAAYLQGVGVEERELRWRERLVTGARQIAVATLGGQVVGVVSWGPGELDAGLPPVELKSLYVGREHRGTGLASDLLRYALAADAAWLWVFGANARAVGCYAKHGFSPDGHRQVDPDTGVDEVRMVRGPQR